LVRLRRRSNGPDRLCGIIVGCARAVEGASVIRMYPGARATMHGSERGTPPP
jgi:hypothetical protein